MNRKIVFMLGACASIGLAQAASAQQAYYAPPAVIAPAAPPAVREEVIPARPAQSNGPFGYAAIMSGAATDITGSAATISNGPKSG